MKDLNALLDEVLPPDEVKPAGGIPIAKVRYTHDAMINLMIAQPSTSQNHLALHFGYSASWVSQIISSDAFQARLAERTEELVDPTIRATVEENLKGLMVRSLTILKEKLSQPAANVPDNLALRAMELSSRALGYGARPDNPPVANVHLHLEDLGGRLTDLLHKKKAEALFDASIVAEVSP